MAKAKLTPAEKAAKARQDAYRELTEWAIRTIANHIIRSGFSELPSLVERVFTAYRQYERDHPMAGLR